MLDTANSGPEPTAEILRAIRHGIAAGACREAWRATGGTYWHRAAADHRAAAQRELHHTASARSSVISVID